MLFIKVWLTVALLFWRYFNSCKKQDVLPCYPILLSFSKVCIFIRFSFTFFMSCSYVQNFRCNNYHPHLLQFSLAWLLILSMVFQMNFFVDINISSHLSCTSLWVITFISILVLFKFYQNNANTWDHFLQYVELEANEFCI